MSSRINRPQRSWHWHSAGRITAGAQTRVLTADDYARAERMLGHNTSPLVDQP